MGVSDGMRGGGGGLEMLWRVFGGGGWGFLPGALFGEGVRARW